MNSSGHSCPKSMQMLSVEEKPLIGVIGGSGLCTLPELAISENVEMETPYGKPSGPINIGELGGGRIAFLPRHGYGHTIPPHRVPYKANIAALKSLGVQHVIGTCVVGSLRKEIEPGAFVIPDQFINLTFGRDDTFNGDRRLVHLPMARPYCEHVRSVIARELKNMEVHCQTTGTVVVIQGPRFSTYRREQNVCSLGWRYCEYDAVSRVLLRARTRTLLWSDRYCDRLRCRYSQYRINTTRIYGNCTRNIPSQYGKNRSTSRKTCERR